MTTSLADLTCIMPIHNSRKILFVASEAHPYMKTGGLGDVCGSLPLALNRLDQDVRIIMPAYRDSLQHLSKNFTTRTLLVPDYSGEVRLLEDRIPGTRTLIWLVDAPEFFDRPGNPYLGPDGRDWPDNAARYALFARAAVTVALNQAGLNWQADIVHCHDWQSGLVPALLSLTPNRPVTVFTIHNLAYQGLFPAQEFQNLHLPQPLWSIDGLEFYGKLSFIKGGLGYADMLSTVSPTYAREICTAEYGCGLDTLLSKRANRLVGILNGADYNIWNPGNDPYLEAHYSLLAPANKAVNKAALQRESGLPVVADAPLISMIGRLVEQKGVDLILEALPGVLKRGAQFVLLGTGETRFEQALRALALSHPDQLHVSIGFNERMAHRIESGADMFLMPSRFEPCGLNQLYSLRYGTVPIVRRTGGLVDSVVDATPRNLESGAATGFVFDAATPAALLAAIERGIVLYRQPRAWAQLLANGMRQDFSWEHSALSYLELYQRAAMT